MTTNKNEYNIENIVKSFVKIDKNFRFNMDKL